MHGTHHQMGDLKIWLDLSKRQFVMRNWLHIFLGVNVVAVDITVLKSCRGNIPNPRIIFQI